MVIKCTFERCFEKFLRFVLEHHVRCLSASSRRRYISSLVFISISILARLSASSSAMILCVSMCCCRFRVGVDAYSKERSSSSISSSNNQNVKSQRNNNLTPNRATLLRRSILQYFHHLVCELLRPAHNVPLYELCTFGATKMTLTRLLRMDYHSMMESRFLTGRGNRRSSKKRKLSGISAPVMYVFL